MNAVVGDVMLVPVLVEAPSVAVVVVVTGGELMEVVVVLVEVVGSAGLIKADKGQPSCPL